METGFFHPLVGYWQTTGTPSPAIVASYPSGTVTVPIKPGPHFDWISGAWVACTPAAEVPSVISKLQAELAAGQATVQAVEAFMADPATPWAMTRGWASAKELHRDSQMVDELAYALGWNSAQVDALFIAAAQIVA